MRRLQDIKGEEALDVLAEILDPIVKLVRNPKVLTAVNTRGFRDIETVKIMIQEGKHEVLQIMAILDAKPYDEFLETFDILTLPVMLYQTFNDESLQAVFTSQSQIMGETGSGFATENIEEKEN